MKLIDTDLGGVKIVEPEVFGDDRGFFFEAWNARTYAAAGLDANFVQDNQSCSRKGVLRGLHYQLVQPQGKLVRVAAGRACDVVVDIRRSSPSFGRWAAVELSAENKRLLWVPPGFAHGFMALEDATELIYKCTEFYAPEHDRSILWSDPEIGIDWPLREIREPLLSRKDAGAVPLAQAEVYP